MMISGFRSRPHLRASFMSPIKQQEHFKQIGVGEGARTHLVNRV